jgi:hypothetical protein
MQNPPILLAARKVNREMKMIVGEPQPRDATSPWSLRATRVID